MSTRPQRKPQPVDRTALSSLLPRFSDMPVVLLGDLVLDEFAFGEISRVSREAPVLILDYKESRYVPGGGANAAANLAALGAGARVIGRIGRDAAAESLMALFEERRIDRSGIVRDRGYRTPVKTRILAGGAHTSKQQVVRIDRGTIGQPLSREMANGLLSRFRRKAKGARALLVADYGFGSASPALFNLARPRPPIVTLDSRFRILEFRGVTAATPNVAEVEQALGCSIGDDDLPALAEAGSDLRRALQAKAVVVTQGSRGMTLFEGRRRPLRVPPFGSDEIADVTGAGDTVISAFTLALACGASFAQATELANVAGGLVVMKRGTATVSVREMARALASGSPPPIRRG